MRHHATTFALTALTLVACSKLAPRVDDAMVAARAQGAVAGYRTALKAELGAAIAKGPVEAIEVCASRAPALAIEHSQGGVRVGRTSAKLRNLANAAPEWLGPVMAQLATSPKGSTEGRLVPLGGGRFGYAEPIWTQAACLTCHGTAIPIDVDLQLQSRYPGDAARGYREGELRGVYYAELDRSAAKR